MITSLPLQKLDTFENIIYNLTASINFIEKYQIDKEFST